MVDKAITIDNLRLLCLVVNVCRGTARRPRYKYSITVRWKFCSRFINSRLNAQYSSNLSNEVGTLFGILKYVCDIVVKSSRSLSQLLMSSCSVFQDAAVRHLGFLKVENFNCPYHSESQNALHCQILCRSVEPLQRYGRFRFFKMAAVRHLGFIKNGRHRWSPTWSVGNTVEILQY